MGFFDGMDTNSFNEDAPVVKPITPAKEIKTSAYDENEVEDEDYAPEPETFFDADNSDVEDRRLAFEKNDSEVEYTFDDLEQENTSPKEAEEDDEDMPYGDEKIPEGALPKVKMPEKSKKEEPAKTEEPEAESEKEQKSSLERKEEQNATVTRISDGVTVTGSVSAPSARVVVEGTISGDVSASEVFVKETGVVKGSIFAKELTIDRGTVGEIKVSALTVERGKIPHGVEVEGVLEIKKDAVITGHVTSGATAIHGKVKGDIDSSGVVYLYGTAVVKGNISALDVILHDGSKLQGSITKTGEIDDSEFE